MDFEQAPPSQGDDIYNTTQNFEVTKKVGRGQFSVVYEACNKIDSQKVALKKVQVCVCSQCDVIVIC